MTLDEMEKLAREQLSGEASAGSHIRQLLRADKLARFIVNALPVVRAAEAVRAATPCESAAEMRERGFHPTSCELVDAIDALHEEMRKG